MRGTRKPKSERLDTKPGHREVKLSGVRTMRMQVQTAEGYETVVLTVPADLTSTRIVVSYTSGVDVKFPSG